MTREQAKNLLISMGIVEPTEEQVSSYLNSISAEVNKEKLKASKTEEELSLLKASARELEELKKKNMSDIELANSERDKAMKNVKDLETKIRRMELKTGFAEQGITGETADKLIDSMASGGIDLALLGEIIQSKQDEAVNNKVAELSAQTIQPNSGSIDTAKEKTDADRVVESVVASLSRGEATTVIDAYK